jgi:hypothetical protein
MTKSSSRLFVLGAADPEMQAIEALLRAAGEKFAYATTAAGRCHPGNAYKADRLVAVFGGDPVREELRPVDLPRTGQVVLVECDLPGCFCRAEENPEGFMGEVTVIDHHRPGDTGYSRGPEEFLTASSVGQVLVTLRGGYLSLDGMGEWRHYNPASAGSEDVPELVDNKLLIVAAADHCLEAAYRGRCPGVDPDELMQWRAASRAAFQKRPVEEVLRDVEAARKILRDKMLPDSGGGFADLRGRHVPELPEAAAREGIPFLATVTDRDGREKVILQAAGPDLVCRFLDGEVIPGLKEIYGNPARGFAGGYTS